jgi:UDP-N-acetylmuramyl pentapeptide phosphotransferase/UDP-N-acetylglucosamine-1-phosphate transferase
LYALPVSKTNLDSPIVLLFALIFGVGMLNAYNFMDGINGMLLLHVLVVLGTLMSINMGWMGVERHHVPFIDNNILGIAFFTALLLSFVNVRNRALGFIGDVGALGFAFVILYALYQLFAQTQNYTYFIFIGLFGIDTGSTIAVKLWRGESVVKPHRDFLFKRMTHLYKWKHLNVSLPYALVQLLSNSIVLQLSPDLSTSWQLFWLVTFIVSMIVFYISFFKRTSLVKRILQSLFFGKKFLGLF